MNQGSQDYRKSSTLSDEEVIMSIFRRLFPTTSKFCPDNHKIHFARIVNSIIDKKRWTKWKNNSEDTGHPPDYYNDDEKIMIEIMRVDHYTYKDNKGKPHNRNTENVGKVVRMLMDDGRTDILEDYIITGAVELEEHEPDYNYDRYLDSFRAVLEQHIEQIPEYRRNHPGFKLVFFDI